MSTNDHEAGKVSNERLAEYAALREDDEPHADELRSMAEELITSRSKGHSAHYSTFDDWFVGQEGFAIRAERFEGDVEWLRAAFDAGRDSRQTGAVRVNTLKWEGVLASTPFCSYSVGDYGDDAPNWRWVRSEYPYGERSDDGYPTEAEAKAAAQADYERRILSALEPTPIKETAEPAVPADVQGITDEWIRDTAMNVMLATEVEEAIRTLTAALSNSDYQRIAAENERLRAERDEADHALIDKYRNPQSGVFSFPGDVAAIIRRLEAAESKLAEAVKVLKPFADVADYDIGADEDDSDTFRPMISHNRAAKITVGNMRAARTFLASLTRAEGDA